MNDQSWQSRQALWIGAFIAVASAGLLVRLALFDLSNADLQQHFLVWLERIRTLGFWRAVSEPFSAYGYTPLYSYGLGITNALWGPHADGVWVIKSMSAVFDYAVAALMATLAWWRWRTPLASLLGFAATLFAPTVLLNGAAWGQSDIVYTGMLLAMVCAVIDRRPTLALLCFALALATKAQAVFLAPFVLLLLLRKELSWRGVVAIPLVYPALAVPVVLAGRRWPEVASIYATQASTQNALALGAPNLHFFLERWSGSWTSTVAAGAIGVAALATAVFALSGRRIPGSRLPPQTVLLAALVSATMLPHVLPHMHERYFMPAEVLAIAWAIWQPGAAWVAAALQVISMISYAPFLLAPVLGGSAPASIATMGFASSMQALTALLALGSVAHIALLGWLVNRWGSELARAGARREAAGGVRAAPMQS